MNESHDSDPNIDNDVIKSFGEEWKKFDYENIELKSDLDLQFKAYSLPIDLSKFDPNSSVAADFGAGSGRWTIRLAPYFAEIYAVDPSPGSIDVLTEKFKNSSKIKVLKESVGTNSILNDSLDLAMSLGVLHHLPDTAKGIQDVAKKIKPGGLFWCYLYYKLENKSSVYRIIFRVSVLVRLIVSHMPYSWRRFFADTIAFIIYLPLARLSRLLEIRGKKVANFPLHHYANMPFLMMRNDALDRFGTQLEKRFTREEISKMLFDAGFDLASLNFSEAEPFWTFSVKKL
jgi:SAM-dependent methyltransferase